MNRLLRAGARRYCKSRYFRVVLLLSLLVGMALGIRASKIREFEEMFATAGFLLIAVSVSFTVGREYAEGQFRNKLTAGYGRGTVFFSELLLAFVSAAVMFLAMVAGFSVFNHGLFDVVPYDIMASVFAACLLSCLAAAGVYAAVSCLVTNRAVAVVLNIVLLVVAVNTYSSISTALNQSEFYYVISTDQLPQDGELLLPDEPRGKRVDNPAYVGGVKREVYKFAQKASPFGVVKGCTAVMREYLFAADGIPVADESKNRSAVFALPLYMLGVTVFASALGYAVFRKKEFR